MIFLSMTKIKLLLLSLLLSSFCFGQKNLTLLSNYKSAPGTFYAGVWHYNDSANAREYALLGTDVGLTIVDITNPANPQHIFDVPDSQGIWREVKVWKKYAYVSNEGQKTKGGGGITIIDLSTLPGAPVYKKYTSDGPIAGTLSTAHTVQVEDGYLYVNGSNIQNRGTIIYSLADPWNPAYTGIYDQKYVHDCFVRGNLLITSEIFANPSGFSIIDITDKTNPAPISSQETPFRFNHNAWMSDDSKYLFTTDELDNAPVGVYDISNVNDITGPLDLYLTNKNPVGEVHNVRVLNDFIVNACYGDADYSGSQVTIVDASRPGNLIEVGDYELSTKGSGLKISWDVDPYLPSGNLLATEGDSGLFIFAPTYRRACHLEGIVTDSITGNPLNNVKVEILSTSAYDSTKFTGGYATGVADSGLYTVVFTKSGYITKSFTNVLLKNGVLTTLDVKLWNGITGLNKSEAGADLLRVYPNPAHNEAQIRINPSLLGDNSLRLVITDALGRTVKEIKNIQEGVFTVSRSGLANGSYTLQLIKKEGKVAETGIIFQ